MLGVGSELKGDDASGVIVCKGLKEAFKKKGRSTKGIFLGGTAPENLTSEIKRFRPDTLIIIDSADMNKRPGCVKLFNPDNISQIAFSTHKLPLKIMIDYIQYFFDCRVIFIGIQPGSLVFGEYLTAPVNKAVKEIVKSLALSIPVK